MAIIRDMGVTESDQTETDHSKASSIKTGFLIYIYVIINAENNFFSENFELINIINWV